MQDTRCKIQDAGCRMPDDRMEIRDSGFTIHDSRYCIAPSGLWVGKTGYYDAFQMCVGVKMAIFFFIFLIEKLCSDPFHTFVIFVMKKIIYLPFIALLVTSCWDWKKLPPSPEIPPVKVLGYVPTYSNDPALYNIYADTPRAMKNPGKIYVKDNLIFQNDLGFGIHVIDKTIPSQLKSIGFINLRGNVEMSIKGNYLYANSYSDLVVVEITNWREVKEIQRIKAAFQKGNEAYAATGYIFVPLPEKKVYYQCVDIYKGIHTGWKQDSIYNNTCFNY